MVSRRSVRVKVMQLLYAQTRDSELTKSELMKRYDEGVDQSFELLMFTLYLFLNISSLAVEDKKKKQAKHIKSEEDQTFSARLYHNPLIQSLATDTELKDEFARYKFEQRVDADFFKKMYVEFAKMEEYSTYLKADDTVEVHLDILLELFRFLRKNEYFSDVLDDNYSNWMDDKSLVIGTMKKMIKELPVQGRFFEAYYPDTETARDYGQVLLKEVGENEAYLLSLIEPTLKNWDADRLAIIDMILLKMALAEFLYFPTIPTKVTLNEYLEVSKQYSTPKSKDFINGILDRLMKSLDADGKINKEGRGLIQ
jgi:transcription antitermination protein NusB